MGTMASFITKTYIKDIALLKNGKKRPSSKGTIPVFGGNGIMDYVNQHNDENAVIVGRVGAYCGCVYLCESKCWISDNAISAKAKEGTDNRFLYYLLKNLDLNHHHIGGAQPLMTQDIIGRIEVNVPSFDVQKRIADILSSLDAKIENNNKINAKLEEMAQALFKSWFIDFEPFKVGCDGSRPAFGSGNFVESELGMIPEGWKVGTVFDVADVLDRKRKPLSGNARENMDKIYPYYGATSRMDYVDNYIFDGIYTLMGEDGSVVREDGTPFIQYVWGKLWVNNHAHVLQGKNGFSTEMLHAWLTKTNIQALVTGAVQAKLNQENMQKIRIPIAPIEIRKKFNALISPIYSRLRSNIDENTILAQTRDTLLPKLMSGEIEL